MTESGNGRDAGMTEAEIAGRMKRPSSFLTAPLQPSHRQAKLEQRLTVLAVRMTGSKN